MKKEKMDNREGQILGERRIELGLTQEDVAFEAGISLQRYQRFEYGTQKLSNSRMKAGLRICSALELDPYEVVFGADK